MGDYKSREISRIVISFVETENENLGENMVNMNYNLLAKTRYWDWSMPFA